MTALKSIVAELANPVNSSSSLINASVDAPLTEIDLVVFLSDNPIDVLAEFKLPLPMNSKLPFAEA